MVLSILFAIAAATAALVLAVRVRRQALALGAAGDRATTLGADLDEARNDRAQQVLRADTAEAERDEQRARSGALASEVQVAASTLAEAVRARDAAHAEIERLGAAQSVNADAVVLWSLELARVERRWHTGVAPGMHLTSPLATSAPTEQPRLALEIIAAALREEVGTRFTIDWQITETLPVDVALLTVRTADEILAAAALSCELVHLVVAQDVEQAHVELTVEAFDSDGTPLTLAAIALPKPIDVCGTRVRIPLTVAIPAGVPV